MSDEEKRRWKGPTGKEGSSGRQMNERKIRAHNAKTDSSKQWLERQMSDPYVRKAKLEGFRARAAYKLLEIDAKAELLKRGCRVVDLGCAPGGWLQVAVAKGAASTFCPSIRLRAPISCRATSMSQAMWRA